MKQNDQTLQETVQSEDAIEDMVGARAGADGELGDEQLDSASGGGYIFNKRLGHYVYVSYDTDVAGRASTTRRW